MWKAKIKTIPNFKDQNWTLVILIQMKLTKYKNMRISKLYNIQSFSYSYQNIKNKFKNTTPIKILPPIISKNLK